MPTPTTDSLKILLPADTIEPGFACHSVRTGNKRASLVPGLLSLTRARGTRDEAVLEVSSKILPGPTLIHRSNIEDVFSKVNETGIIAIRPSAIEQAYCLTVDPATDVVMAVSKSEHLLEVVNVLGYHPHYRKKPHRGNHNTTFYYERSNRGKYAGKAKVYDKHAEDDLGVYAPGTVRFEVSCMTGLAIQHCFGVVADRLGRILLKDVLESEANPVADKFEEILANLFVPKAQASTGMEVTRPRFGVNKVQVFRRQLKQRKEINAFNMLCTHYFDIEEVYRTLRPTYKSREGKAKVLEPYIAMLAEYNKFDEELTVDYEVLMSMRELLRDAGGSGAVAVAA